MEDKLDKQKFIKRVIIGAWIALALCFVIKVFGGNYFNIIFENENFIAFCQYADNHKWARILIASSTTLLMSYFTILAMCNKLKFELWEFITIIVGNLLGTVFKIVISREIGLIFDVVNAIIIPCIITIKTPKRHWFVILGNIALVIFQLVSMFVKNISFGIISLEGVLVSLIYSIDVIIMCVLYYLYTNSIRIKKESKNNG